ncbi:hypothetical protein CHINAEXTREME_06165 [Halobiforma lacisalsi AJ5]|uniref:Uncharacterized protein n=1 Tax=Natronobacterium lacisalsi AJ5 TaxID=358396 RepID=M0LXB3_NATLA|nr:hypothetical protein [Halobiforma lacisalsi]APW97378.1 hypothetical protein CHINAEXTREME_06165 [Halobiforma lacisalsi AJ5]EMA38081.1 hypothetical protein C445_00455 [Halobiforma lacisalsi AJ5]
MNPVLLASLEIKNLTYRRIAALGIVAFAAVFLYVRLGFTFIGPLAAILWVPFIGVATVWILFDSQKQGFKHPSIVALTVAILLVAILPGIAALAAYYYFTRFQWNDDKQ